MPLLRQYWKIALCLCAIFASGSGVGYVIGQRSVSPVVTASNNAAPVSNEAWHASNLAKLTKELSLTPEQEEQFSNILIKTEGDVSQSREKAFFKMHLQVLKAHDEFKPLLRVAQQAKLDKMRTELRRQILERFKRLIDELSDKEKELLSSL
jgi:hypothetical protein